MVHIKDGALISYEHCSSQHCG